MGFLGDQGMVWGCRKDTWKLSWCHLTGEKKVAPKTKQEKTGGKRKKRGGKKTRITKVLEGWGGRVEGGGSADRKTDVQKRSVRTEKVFQAR